MQHWIQRPPAALSVAVVVAVGVLSAVPAAAAVAAPPVPVTATPTAPDVQAIPLAPATPGISSSATPGVQELGVDPAIVTAELPSRPFRLVAVTWLSSPSVSEVQVHVRVRQAGVWTSWSSLDVHGDSAVAPLTPGKSSPRLGTDPLWVGDSADGVQARVAGPGSLSLRGLSVDLIEPGSSPAPAAQGVRSAAVTGGPSGVITRTQWGADENIRLRCDPSGPAYTGTPRVGVVHHTAGSNSYTRQDSAAIVRGIYAYHAQTLQWCDIGYNFLTDKYGQIFEGRFGGMDKPVWGAHVGDFNENTFGVAVLGDYTQVPADNVTLEALSQVIAYKFGVDGTDPYGTASLVSAGAGFSRFPQGAVVVGPTIVGHKDLGYTADPGNIEAKLPQIRDRVAQLTRITNFSPTLNTERWWELRNGYNSGPAGYSVYYGGPNATTLSCDVNGDGRDDLIAYENGTWYIRTSVDSGPATVFNYGAAGWIPVCGDWDGNGTAGIGVYNPATSTWYLRNTPGPGVADAIFSYGFAGTTPIVGDWDGNGTKTIGVYDPSKGNWWTRNNNSAGAPSAITQYGFPGTTPAPGDFNGDRRTDLAVVANGRWYIRTNPGPGQPDRTFDYGLPTDQPLTGNWDGTPGDGIGVSRPGHR